MTKKTYAAMTAAAICFASPATAQEASVMGETLQLVEPEDAEATLSLPANSEVLLRMNQTVTTKGRTWKEGDTFALSVVHDVMQDGYVVIPAGSRAVGRITWLTSKGAFGKSGKMDVELEYVEVRGTRIALDGTYRQEGEGNTVATIGGVLAAGIFAGFITGRSGTIPQGRELMAHTEQAIPLALPDRQGQASAPVPERGLRVTAAPEQATARIVSTNTGGQ